MDIYDETNDKRERDPVGLRPWKIGEKTFFMLSCDIALEECEINSPGFKALLDAKLKNAVESMRTFLLEHAMDIDWEHPRG